MTLKVFAALESRVLDPKFAKCFVVNDFVEIVEKFWGQAFRYCWGNFESR